MPLEHCTECDQETGLSGRGEDSNFITYKEAEIGPLCGPCAAKHWICGECGMGVHAYNITFSEVHYGCGGSRVEAGRRNDGQNNEMDLVDNS